MGWVVEKNSSVLVGALCEILGTVWYALWWAVFTCAGWDQGHRTGCRRRCRLASVVEGVGVREQGGKGEGWVVEKCSLGLVSALCEIVGARGTIRCVAGGNDVFGKGRVAQGYFPAGV